MQTVSQLSVPLSHLVAGRRNPRKVKPAREAHHRLVALIRSQGLLQPLLVRPEEDKPKHYRVIAGERRLSALREIHRGDGDPKIPCVLRDVDVATADAMSLGENFGREAMHPLDEAEAFAKLATHEGKDAKMIASEFGVSEHYVRQRMKLAALADVVKFAYRLHEIDTATAEAFSAVPQERQLEIWKELNGHPRHAEHVRNIIANGWIDASVAAFDASTLPESAVSRDLFSERVLIERQAFMTAQTETLAAERLKLLDEGWKEVVAGRHEDIHDRPLSMDVPEREFDEETTSKLERIASRREKWEAKLQDAGDDEVAKLNRIQAGLEKLEVAEQEIIEQATEYFSDATKSVATAFLTLYPDGKVRREYRVPRRPRHSSSGNGNSGGDGVQDLPKPPTSDDLADKQLAATFTHEALLVREALLENARARKRILALVLHEKIRSEGLAIRHDANGTTVHASLGEEFISQAFERLQAKRAKLDPFADDHFVEDLSGYSRLAELSDSKLDALIDLLTVECITAHMQRRTELVHHLSVELKVKIRDHWRPDAAWLASYQKIQLSNLMAELYGPVYSPGQETRKKSELVDALAKLFADAAEGKLEDKKLTDRVNRWLPVNLRETVSE